MREKIKYTINMIKDFLSKCELNIKNFLSGREFNIKNYLPKREFNTNNYLSGCKAGVNVFLSKCKVRSNDFLARHDFTKGEAYIIGSSAGALVLILALTIAVSSSVNSRAGLEADMIAMNDSEIELIDEDEEESTEYTDGVYIDGILYAKQVYALVVDGTDIVYLASNENAQAVLDGITNRYAAPGAEILSLSYKENVAVEKRDFEWPAPVFEVQDAINYVITGTTAPRTYIIKGGDNLWDIAIRNGISLSSLEEMNPGLNPKRLSIGQEIYLYETQPFITVGLTKRVTSQERISYDVIFEDTDNLYRGQTQVRIAGSYGSKEVISEITKENGIETASKILSSERISEPVTQVALRGTKPLPVFTGTSTGQLSNPVASMKVISNYGSRGGRLHHGVDLGGPTGTPIYAAADGVVVEATRRGSYGNFVRLCHGDGIQTVYAHNETNLVSVGESVTKGQQIATMGATGNATTSHLHFEVRINGASRNPMNYL